MNCQRMYVLPENKMQKDYQVNSNLFRINLKTYGEQRLPIFNCNLWTHTYVFLIVLKYFFFTACANNYI